MTREMVRDLHARGVAPAPRSHLGWLGLGYESMVTGRTDAALELLFPGGGGSPPTTPRSCAGRRARSRI